MNKKVIVIGGGPAGMMAAGIAAREGKEVHLFEKNEKLGKKLFITGKGRCNFTNASTIETIIESVIRNPFFLYSAFYTFSNDAVIEFFEKWGVKSKVERGNRVFPLSDKSNDIIKALHKFMMAGNVHIHLNQDVDTIILNNNIVQGVKLKQGGIMKADRVIVATGGLSYPKTGSTGDGLLMAKKLGHKIINPKAALVPVIIKEDWIKDLQGLSLKNVEISLLKNNKLVKREFGEMIFTHYGLSGPIVLSLSSFMEQPYSKYIVSINLKPALSEKQLDQRLQRDFDKYTNKQFKNSLQDILPKKMIPIILYLANIEEDKFVHQITKEERKNLVYLLQNLKISVDTLRPIEEAIVTAGGINTNEINPSTMESKIIEGLYFAGEIMDVDALTGGYNLQIAFSTGYLAGINC